MTKICTVCKEDKNVVEFVKNKQRPRGVQPHCKICNRKRIQEWRKANTQKDKQHSQKSKRKPNIKYSNLKSAAKKRGLSVTITKAQ